MEKWEQDFEWLGIQHKLKERFNRSQLPDLNAVLFLIGIQELGRWKDEFSKEEKQDLMHIAVCRLMSIDGFYRFAGRDADGWPHYEKAKPIRIKGLDEQETLLKAKAVEYFRELEEEE